MSGSPPKYRTKTPPRTLPSQLLDESSPVLFDSRPVPFSPTSPGKCSPGRPKTMKEYEEDIVNLKRENFNLKVRIYFMEQSRFDPSVPKDIDELRTSYTNLKIDYELQKKDLAKKEDLLLNSYRAIDAQKQQIESMKTEHDSKTQELQTKIECLEKDLKEYQIKFMETSVQLDDTNAIYAITFGLGNKPEDNRVDNDNLLQEKIKELECCLEEEKEHVLSLEGTISELNCKQENDQKDLHSLRNKLITTENDLKQAIKEKCIHEESLKDNMLQMKTLLKNFKKCQDAAVQKETEIDSLKKLLRDFEQKVCLGKSKLHEKQEAIAQAHSNIMALKDNMQRLVEENNNLVAKIKHLEQQLKLKSPPREQSSGQRSSDQEDRCRHQKRIREYQKDIQGGKNTKSSYPAGVENFILTLVKDNDILKKEVEKLKEKLSCMEISENCDVSSKEEVAHSLDVLAREMASEKDKLISELRSKIEDLTEVVNDKECKLKELSSQITEKTLLQDHADLKTLVENFKSCENEKEALSKELEEKNKEVECLTKELKKKTYNLQGLVNTELWNKNKEIERLIKLCERKQLEVLSLQKQLKERSLLLQDKVTNFTSTSGIFAEVKENLQPHSATTTQQLNLVEENRLLVRKVEELQARLLNTPERDTESQLIQNLRLEKEEAEKQRKEAMNACVLLTTRLQELADFLDSLLPSLCGRKRRVVQQAVERSRELSRTLSLAAEESSLQKLNCSAWTDLQPSLYLPLLPDISTVDFWSGEESQGEGLSVAEENPHLQLQSGAIAEDAKLPDLSLKLRLENNNEKSFLRSVFDFDQHLREIIVNDALIDDTAIPEAEFTEASLIDSCSEMNNLEQSKSSKICLEAKSANIGSITLTSRKKDSKSSQTAASIDGAVRPIDKEGDLSENEAWSEPDRDVSYARMGLKEESSIVKSLQFNCNNDTSETVDSAPKSPSARKSSEIHRLQRKIRSLEQVNEALRSELVILHQLAPPSLSRQDKTTSIEVSRQSALCIPSHLLEEIKNQREKLEASLFHNDYIRRQLENTASSLRKSQGDDQETRTIVLQLKEVTSQLELAECELSKLKLEKDGWARKVDLLQTTLEQTSNELVEKQCALITLEKKMSQRLREEEEIFSKKCSETEQRCSELEQKWMDLQRERDQLLENIVDNKVQISKLKSEVQHFEQEGKKNKQLQEELNVKVQQIFLQKDDLQRVVSEQEQLLADAEREREELATQLLARDRQVSELQARLSRVESTSSEVESDLRAQLDLATQQCNQYEAKIRDLDNSTKREEGAVVELRSRLDAARFAHSEAVLQYTRIANENIRLQQELRRRQHEPQTHQVEMMKSELERRVGELEAANGELQSKLKSLDVRAAYSDYETDAGSSVVGSPRRPPLPHHFQVDSVPAVVGSPPLAISTHHYVAQRSHDLTSDYLSDQDAALSSPQSQTRNMWFPSHSQASASPDLGIESDHGRFSSLETQTSKSTALSIRGAPVKDLVKLEEENTQLRRNLQKTRHALEETLTQLTSANQHKRQYEAQLSAANQQKAKVERAICRQITKTQSILKKAKVNLEDDWNNINH